MITKDIQQFSYYVSSGSLNSTATNQISKKSSALIKKKLQKSINQTSLIGLKSNSTHLSINSNSLPKIPLQGTNELLNNTEASFASLNLLNLIQPRNGLTKLIDNKRRNALGEQKSLQMAHDCFSQRLSKWEPHKDYLFLKDPTNNFLMAESHNDQLEESKKKKIIQGDLQQIQDNNQQNKVRINEIITKLKDLINFIKVDDVDASETVCQEIINHLRLYRNGNLYLMFLFVFGQILEIYGKWKQSIIVWNKILSFCNSCQIMKYKIISYKNLSIIYLKLKEIEKSFSNARKLIKLAWLLNIQDYELDSYEQIAKIYYYNHQIDPAKYFHSRYMDGQLQNKNTKVRMIAEQSYFFRQQTKALEIQMNSDSDDDFDLMQIPNDKFKVLDSLFKKELKFFNIEQESMRRKKNLMKVLIHHQRKNDNYSMQKIQEYVDHQCEPLGPILKNKKLSIQKSEQINQEMFVGQQYYFHLSNNRDVRENIIARENLNKYHKELNYIYRPHLGAKTIFNLINLYLQDATLFFINNHFYE